MPSDPDNFARLIAFGSLTVSIAALLFTRRDLARKGTKTKTTLLVDATGYWTAIVRNPTELDVRIRLTLVGARTRRARAIASLVRWGPPLAPAEWRNLSEVMSSYGGILSELLEGFAGYDHADVWVTVPAKDHVEWRFRLTEDWRPKYLAVMVENRLGGLRRGPFKKSDPYNMPRLRERNAAQQNRREEP